MHITITGRLGSGKSTVAKIIVAEHGYTYYSTKTSGDTVRLSCEGNLYYYNESKASKGISAIVTFSNAYGFSIGIDMLSEDFDYLELMSFRGKYFLEFLKEAAALSHTNGKTVGIELIAAFESPELNDDLGGLCHALMPKICFDYKAAVELCDEVVLKDKLDGGYDATVASGIKAYASELGKKCYVFCHSDYGNLQEPYLDAVLRDAACGGAIAEISHMENALDNIKGAMVK